MIYYNDQTASSGPSFRTSSWLQHIGIIHIGYDILILIFVVKNMDIVGTEL